MAFNVGDLSGYALKAWGFLAILILIVFLALVTLAILYYFIRARKFEYIVRVKKEEPIGSGNIFEIGVDKGGIFMDKKTKNRIFVLKKFKVGMMPDNIPYYINSKGKKIVEVLQLGLKSFRYLDKPKIVANSQTALYYNVQDQDLAFAINTIENVKQYKKQTWLQQLAPFIGMAFVFLLIVVSLYFIFKNISVLKDVAESFNQAAQTFRETQLGAVAIQGGGTG